MLELKAVVKDTSLELHLDVVVVALGHLDVGAASRLVVPVA